MRYFVIHIRYSLLIFVVRYPNFFFRKAHYCAVTNNESNAIAWSVRNRKIQSKTEITSFTLSRLLRHKCVTYSSNRCNQL